MSPGPRSDLLALLLALTAFGVGSVLGPSWWLTAAAAPLCLWTARGSGPMASAGVMIALLATSFALPLPSPFVWPLTLLLPLSIWAGLAWRRPALRPPAASFARGRASWGWVLATVLVTAPALTAWVWLADPDLEPIHRYLPDLPLPLLLLGALLFPLPNALVEEGVFRGVLQRSLETRLGLTAAPVILQSLSFGLLHYQGFPSGVVGAVMAGAWGLVLGLLRRSTGGLLTPILIHVAADATIFTIILVTARG